MSDDGNEIDVEAIDTSILDETVEVTFRGDAGAIMEVGNALDLAVDTITTTDLMASPGWAYAAAVLHPTMNDFADQFQTDELMALPEGIREADDENLEDELEVDVRWVDREPDNSDGLGGFVIEAHVYDDREAEAFKDLFERLPGVATWKFERYQDTEDDDA